MNVYLLSGQQNSGKSTALHQLAVYLSEKCGGVICLPVFDGQRKIGTDAFDVITGQRVPFSRLTNSSDSIRIGHQYIRPTGIKHCLQAIGRAVAACRLIIIDEIGPLELRGDGLFSGVQKSLIGESDVLMVVRSSLTNAVVKRFCLGQYVTLYVENNMAAQWQRIVNYNSGKRI